MTGPGAPYPALSGAGAGRLLERATRVVVTGAGGWLGLATLEMLHALLGPRFPEQVACFGSAARTLALRGGLTAVQEPLERLGELAPAPTLVLHLAFLTQEKAKVMSPEAYCETNRALSGTVLEALDGIGAEGVFVASSGAVHLADLAHAEPSKRLYGALKREDEARFGAWAARAGRPAVMARVFNLSGPYINKRASYALACFIADALAGRPIAIRAAHPVYRSYVAISELMSVVFGALTEPTSEPITFDTAGDAVYEMAQIADMVQEVLGQPRRIERPPLGDEAPDRYVGDGATYRTLRHRFEVAPTGVPSQVLETACYMAEHP